MSATKPIFWIIMLTITLTAITGALLLGFRLLNPALQKASDDSLDDRYRQLARAVTGLYDTVPDAQVGRILQQRVEKTEAGASVVSNNAGMRSRFNYAPKAPDRYRIVFLGDSFTYGYAGAESDRYSDQIAEMLAGFKMDGRLVEVLNLSIGSWTALNEARYLTARLSAYDPDLIVVLTVSNDISDTQGVRGIGTISNTFSPEYRQRGSGVFNNAQPQLFGVAMVNLLAYDLAEESRYRWRLAAGALARLAQLQTARGGRILFTILKEDPYFNALFHSYLKDAGVDSPVALIDYVAASDTRLAHDPHPNRLGHRRIAMQTLGHLVELGWLEGFEAEVDRSMTLWRSPHPEPEAILDYRQSIAADYLLPAIDFSKLEPLNTAQFLGGVLPDKTAKNPLTSPPFAAPYAAFLLRRAPDARRLLLEIALPAQIEVYPLEVRLSLQGVQQSLHRFEQHQSGDRVVLSTDLPGSDPEWPGLEVRLESNHHFSGIVDQRTLSFRLIRVWQDLQ